MRMLVSACAILLLCGATGLAWAQTRSTSRSADQASRMIAAAQRWDANGDGIYTCDEWKTFVTKIFNDADRNRDGYVDANEFKTVRGADAQFKDADLGYFDDNRDGRLSRVEFVEKPNPFFLQYDKNRDCRVTFEELTGLPLGTGKPGGGGFEGGGRGGRLR